MRTHKIAALGGDGIGPEVVEAGLEALQVCAERDGGFNLDVERFDWGSDYYREHGVMMPADGADRLRAFDAILFGAVGSPGIPDHVTLWGLRLAICQPLDQ
jgi:tartrate dehydrogenase/decarboxylase/D-malate dehydrogenase